MEAEPPLADLDARLGVLPKPPERETAPPLLERPVLVLDEIRPEEEAPKAPPKKFSLSVRDADIKDVCAGILQGKRRQHHD